MNERRSVIFMGRKTKNGGKFAVFSKKIRSRIETEKGNAKKFGSDYFRPRIRFPFLILRFN